MLIYVCKKLFLPVDVLLVTSVIPGPGLTVATVEDWYGQVYLKTFELQRSLYMHCFVIPTAMG